MVQDGRYPFTTRLPVRESEFLKPQQQAAVVCFHIMKKMMFTSRVPSIEVFACRHYYHCFGVHYAQISSNFLMYSQQNSMASLFGQNDSGSCSEQAIYLDKSLPGLRLSLDGSFSNNRRYLSVFGSGNQIHIYRRGSENWHSVIRYVRKLVILSLDSQGCWNLTWQTRRTVGAHVGFSPSEQHAAISYKNKVVVLSLDSRGYWKLSWETPSAREINFAEFCPSGSWLMIAYRENGGDSVADMIKFNPKCRTRQITLPRYFDFTFSHDGNYLLVSNRFRDQHLLWVLLKSDQWVSYGDLNAPGLLPWPERGQSELRLSTAVFSSCDNHLFTSTRDGAVKIWGQDGQGRPGKNFVSPCLCGSLLFRDFCDNLCRVCSDSWLRAVSGGDKREETDCTVSSRAVVPNWPRTVRTAQGAVNFPVSPRSITYSLCE